MDVMKVSSEVAEAMDAALQEFTAEAVVEIATKKDFTGIKKPLNNLGAFNISKMIIRGYKIKETPEEYLLQIYRNHLERPSIQTSWNDGYAEGIKRTLEILDIKVKGINE